METIHQHVQRKKEKMARLADLQRKIDEATEEVRHLTQDDQDRRPQYRELRQEGLFNEDGWYDDFNHDTFTFDDASPLAAELQAIPWPQSYKPPQLPMYDGHSDPKQFLMSYEATISSYGCNVAVMEKSFVMAVWNVAQTCYSFRPGTTTSWQKLKDMLVTSFQGFQTKPVTAQALFQCTQDHEEYLQAYVRRFLRLRAQAPTVPNEIVIEAMIKGLRLGPTAKYFTRKPPQTLEKLLQKMDEYIWADNDFRQRREEAYRLSKMTRGFKGRIHPDMSDQSTAPVRVTTKQANFRGHSIPHNLRGSSKVPLGHQLQGAEAPGASEEDMGIIPGKSIVYFVVRTRAILQECAKLLSRSKRRSQKPKLDRINRSRSCTPLRAILPTYQSMWAIILQPLLLQLAIVRLLGLSFHRHHHCNLHIPGVCSQKGASTLNSNANSRRNLKLIQSTTLCQSQSTFIEQYPTSEILLSATSFWFLVTNKQCKSSFKFLQYFLLLSRWNVSSLQTYEN
jgi:hypothetical protein